MFPLPIINQTPIIQVNTIISFLSAQGTLTKIGIDEKPTDYFTASLNALKFANSTSSKIQVGTSGVPAAWQIANNTNFVIETYVKLPDTSTRILCGNLNNSGTGSWWVVLNNTFGTACQVAMDGFSTTGSVQRFHLGTSPSTLAINTWHHIVITRNGSTFQVVLNGTSLGTLIMSLGFQNHSNPFTVGNSTDNAYNFNGSIDSFHMTMTNI